MKHNTPHIHYIHLHTPNHIHYMHIHYTYTTYIHILHTHHTYLLKVGSVALMKKSLRKGLNTWGMSLHMVLMLFSTTY